MKIRGEVVSLYKQAAHWGLQLYALPMKVTVPEGAIFTFNCDFG